MWKNFLGILCSLILVTISCKTSDKEVIWQPDVYVGVPKTKSIVKVEDGEKREVKCESQEFSNYICMGSHDVKRMFDLCLRAKK